MYSTISLFPTKGPRRANTLIDWFIDWLVLMPTYIYLFPFELNLVPHSNFKKCIYATSKQFRRETSTQTLRKEGVPALMGLKRGADPSSRTKTKNLSKKGGSKPPLISLHMERYFNTSMHFQWENVVFICKQIEVWKRISNLVPRVSGITFIRDSESQSIVGVL